VNSCLPGPDRIRVFPLPLRSCPSPVSRRGLGRSANCCRDSNLGLMFQDLSPDSTCQDRSIHRSGLSSGSSFPAWSGFRWGWFPELCHLDSWLAAALCCWAYWDSLDSIPAHWETVSPSLLAALWCCPWAVASCSPWVAVLCLPSAAWLATFDPAVRCCPRPRILRQERVALPPRLRKAEPQRGT
jgi:hypothetical protein